MDKSLSALFSIVMLTITVLVIASVWKVFSKAGKPGWAAIVPIYNIVALLKIAGKPVWWLILFLIPIVNVVVLFIAYISLAKNFGKGAGFGVGLVLLSFIFFPILGFGNAQYLGTSPGPVYPQVAARG
jgi:hypothetical protein